MRKKQVITRIIVIVLAAAMLAGVVHAVLGAGFTTSPEAYVVFDGTKYYLIDLNQLIQSYLQYRIDPNAEGAKLAKFYFDTTTGDLLTGYVAYVSAVTEKFVSFSAVISKYMELRDTDKTYIWFNDRDATPAFPVKTKVWVMGADAQVTGRVWVDEFGYIIPRAGYTIAADIAAEVDVDLPAEFTLTVKGDDFGSYPFAGVLKYEVTGGDYTLEYFTGSAWEELTGGFISPSGGMDIPTDWDFMRTLRFTALDPETEYALTFRLEDQSGRPGLDPLAATQTYAFTSGTAEAPVEQFIELPGFVRMGIAANQQTVEVNLFNPAGNPCYFKLKLALADGTVLYQSALIEPGKGLYSITLNQALAPGAYAAVLTYETFCLTDGTTPMNGAELLIELVAQ